MDTYFWIDVRILYDPAHGSIHVHYFREIAQANEKILRNKMGSIVGIYGPNILYPCIYHVVLETGHSTQTNAATRIGI